MQYYNFNINIIKNKLTSLYKEHAPVVLVHFALTTFRMINFTHHITYVLFYNSVNTTLIDLCSLFRDPSIYMFKHTHTHTPTHIT